MACGHTHFQMVRRFDDALLVNPGSVGLPVREQAPVMRIAPWAEYAIVDSRTDGFASTCAGRRSTSRRCSS